MHGMMMHRPLLISGLLEFAAEVHGSAEVVSVKVEDGSIHRQNYRQTLQRCKRLANALQSKLGVQFGQRVATLAWNGFRHFELYYSISGIGAICHTVNPRVSEEQMAYIVNHADDKVLFTDLTFVPIVEKMIDRLPESMTIIIMTDRANMPETSLTNVLCYEELLEASSNQFEWPEFDENTAAALCYTSGTTGNPKGSLYSNRSTLLHALSCGCCYQSAVAIDRKILPAVPLFHVNAWGLPYTGPLMGASLVMPGANLDGKSLFDLMDAQGVHSAFGVPTVWLGLLEEMKRRNAAPSGFKEVIIGGSAVSKVMVQKLESFGVTVRHTWGMTEMSPIGTANEISGKFRDLPPEEQLNLKLSQGRRLYGVEMKILDEERVNALPHDGNAIGELFVRGNSVISEYFEDEEATRKSFDSQGWFGTGDVVSISEEGFLKIADRAKDLIKSGGEWISSIDLESLAMSHPQVSSCAVIGIPSEKWGERPLLIVVPAEGGQPTKESLLELLSTKFAKWQLPEDVVYVDKLPLNSTGKVSKLTLRKQMEDYSSAS